MNRRHREKHNYILVRSQIRWQKVASVCTFFLVLTAIVALSVSIIYNNKLIRESIESRVAENRPLIDIRMYPEISRKPSTNFHLEIKNVGRGNAYNIHYSYHYYDVGTKKIIWEFGNVHSGEECFTVLEPGKVLNYFTEDDRRRFNIKNERDGLPYIWAIEKEDEIKRMIGSTIVACAVYVEYEDFKGNVFWTGRRFGVMNRAIPFTGIVMQYQREMTEARGPFMRRARERMVRSIHDLEGLKVFERKDLIQTEKLEDTLSKRDLK